METTYTWLIWNMKRDPVTGSVGEVFYKVRAEKETAQAIYSGYVLLLADPASPSFVPYEDLTPDIVIEWVKTKLDETGNPSQAMLYENLDAQIAKILAPKEDNGTPWN